jgi:hypothetical protein
MTEELSRLVQEYREKWDSIAGKQIEDFEYKAIDSKNGETEGENVDTTHG